MDTAIAIRPIQAADRAAWEPLRAGYNVLRPRRSDGARAGAGARRVYWQTRATNMAGRQLYDRVASHLGFIVYSHDA